MKKIMMIMAMLMLVIFNGCENGCDETSTISEEDHVIVYVHNVSYVTLKDVVVYGYKHYCDGRVNHAVVDLGNTELPLGSYVSAYFTFNLSNTEDKIVIKVVATGIDAAGDEFKREESVTLTYYDFDYENVVVNIKL
jgi:hypothetical protein